MSVISADTLKARVAGAAVTTTYGLNVGGACTATSFVGDGSSLTGMASTDNIITGTAVTITNTTNSTSTTTGALIISGGVGVALSMTVGGSLSVGGTITYEDVTNQDVIGLATFRSGAQFGVAGVGGTIRANGDTTLVGVVTASQFVGNLTGDATGLSGTPNVDVGNITGAAVTFSGISTFAGGVNYSGGGTLREKVNITAGKLSDNLNINLDNGMIHYFTTTETTTSIPNIISSVGINTELSIGETAAITVITSAAAAAYSVKWKVDGKDTGITTSWVGGSAPSAGNGSGLDTYALTLIKSASETYTIINNLVNSA